MADTAVITAKDLSFYYGENRALKDVSVSIPANRVTALIGPSGCGKSTFLRTLNRMNDLITGVKIQGEVNFHGENIYEPSVDPTVLRRRIGMLVFVAVALSIAGFYLLCITDGFGSIGLADILLVFTAVLFAVHILVIDTLGGTVDAIKLSFGQFCTTAVLSWAGSLIEGSVDWAGAAHSWIPILYAGIGSVGIAYTLQVVGQQWVPPTRASLLMSLESFFSAVGGALLLGEVMTPRGYLGCALIFLGTLLAQAPARLPKWPQR